MLKPRRWCLEPLCYCPEPPWIQSAPPATQSTFVLQKTCWWYFSKCWMHNDAFEQKMWHWFCFVWPKKKSFDLGKHVWYICCMLTYERSLTNVDGNSVTTKRHGNDQNRYSVYQTVQGICSWYFSDGGASRSYRDRQRQRSSSNKPKTKSRFWLKKNSRS